MSSKSKHSASLRSSAIFLCHKTSPPNPSRSVVCKISCKGCKWFIFKNCSLCEILLKSQRSLPKTKSFETQQTHIHWAKHWDIVLRVFTHSRGNSKINECEAFSNIYWFFLQTDPLSNEEDDYWFFYWAFRIILMQEGRNDVSCFADLTRSN